MSDSNSNFPKYWRSLGELCDTPEFRAQLEAEYPEPESPAGFSRRRMLQLMGASMVLATASSCRWEERELLPFNKRPEHRTPGKFEHYATAMELSGSVLGLMVTCVDGRPIKVEGNPNHPNSLGATNAYAQAAILELYDPDRSRHIVEKTSQGDMNRSWEEFTAFAKKHFEEYRKNGGEGLAVISESSNSPTLISLQERFSRKYPKAKWFVYDPVGREQLFLNRRNINLKDADLVVCIENDIFGSNPNAVKNTREFMRNRDSGNGKLKRLYVIESSYSITGAMADHRISLPVNEILKVLEVIREIQDDKNKYILLTHSADQNQRDTENSLEMVVKEIVDRLKASSSPWANNIGLKVSIKALLGDIIKHSANVAVLVGDHLCKDYHPSLVLDEIRSVNAYNASMNSWLNDSWPTSAAGILLNYDLGINLDKLNESVRNKQIDSLLIFGGNPLYNAPANLGLNEFFAEVPTRIHLSRYFNETSQNCTWHVPEAHFLESWGDTITSEGSYSVIQPMIEPLHGGKSVIELLMLALELDSTKAAEEIRNVHKQWTGETNIERRWKELLHEGCVTVQFKRDEETNAESKTDNEAINRFPEVIKASKSNFENGKLEITFRPSPAVYDGRFANLSWLQEMPDPITRLTWDNVALFSPATAEKLGVKHEEIVKLKFKGREIEIPAYILPGQADGSVAVTLGYGRTAAGKVGGSIQDGVAPVGVNTYKLRTSDAMWFGVGLTVEPTGRMHHLASVAEHFAINKDSIGKEGRKERVGELVREATLAEYQKNPTFAQHHEEPLRGKSLWTEHQFEGHRWGMAVDLSKCVGCGACVVACMAENNVPVVGKERIFKNREMHWLRVDRYFCGDMINPQIVFQPVMCQHCEMAPCEGVCPVAATVHSKEGLNEMVYNRCVGTRYCANNCPYKVRRFNYFNYHKQYEDPANEVLKMASNPQVTVRMRGVMEKCTYCVQRIQAVKIQAKNERRTIKDGEIKTACQQVCPAGAIVFGDLSDENSEVSRCFADSRSYQMLEELYTKPRTAYLARIRNPNPELEKPETTEK